MDYESQDDDYDDFYDSMEDVYYAEMPKLESITDPNINKILNDVELINSYDTLINSLNKNNQPYDKIKRFYDSLGDNEIHNTIKIIIDKYCRLTYLDAVQIYKMVLMDIFNDGLTDFTINFPDNTSFHCLKIVLQEIPLFSMIFEDFDEFNNSIDLSIDLTINTETAMTIINLLYDPTTVNLITPNNFCDIFVLMQKWLMEYEYVNIMLEYANNNIKYIISHNLKQKQFNNILIFEEHLNNIKNNDKLKDNVNDILKEMFICEFGCDIFIFNDWQTKFSDKQKLNAIKLTKNYELLNDSKINPVIIIKFLRDFDFASDIYNKIFDIGTIKLFADNHTLNVKSNKQDDFVVIKKFYPIFAISIFKKINATIIQHDFNWIMIQFNGPKSAKICIDKILINLIDGPAEDNVYFITNITKYNDNKSANVQIAKYIHDDTSIVYKLTLNKPLKTFGMLYTCSSFEHKVEETG